jgi:hypothetical protein
MVVPDLIFDAILFGVLLLAVLLDNVFPQQLHGAASLLAIGTATYVAAQEMCDELARRKWWTQESLATALSLSTLGFIYYWWRNDSDISLLGLSIGLMMAALMVMISMIGAGSATLSNKSIAPLLGLTATATGALSLGVLSGLLIFVLTSDVGQSSILIKAVILGVGAVLWKLRENLRPPTQNEMSLEVMSMGNPSRPAPVTDRSTSTRPAATSSASADSSRLAAPRAMAAHPGVRWTLMPERGTLLDRFLPVLIMGAVLYVTLQRAFGFTFK